MGNLIRKNFGDQVIVASCDAVKKGHHNNHHFVVKTTENRWFGIKYSGGIEASRHEVLVSELGRIAGVPSARTVVLDPPGTPRGLPALDSSPVTKEEWTPVPAATMLIQSEFPKTIQNIRENLPSFLDQFSRWTAFGAVVGLVDRANDGNWIWNCETGRLLMIDYEGAFREEFREGESIAFLERGFTPPLLGRPFNPSLVRYIEEGYCAMRDQLRARWPALLAKLTASGLASDAFIASRENWLTRDHIECLRHLFTGNW